MRALSVLLAGPFILSLAAQTVFPPALDEIYYPRTASPILYGLEGGSPRRNPMRSDDRGRTWKPLHLYPAGTDQPASDMAVDSSNPNTVYLATTIERGGVFKSTNGGNTWTRSSEGLPASGAGTVYPIRVADNDPQIVYAAIAGAVYKSSNAGVTWVKRGDTGDPSAVIGFQATSPARMYAMVTGGHIRVSNDEGATWTNAGRIGNDTRKYGVRLTVDAGSAARVYAQAEAGVGADFRCPAPGGGVWRSEDSGQTWVILKEAGYCDLSPRIFVDNRRPFLHLRHPLALSNYCRSDNRGATFPCFNRSPPIGLDPRNSDLMLFAAGRSESTDAGLTDTAIGSTVVPTMRIPEPVVVEVEEESIRIVRVRFASVESSGSYKVPITASTTAGWLTFPNAAGAAAEDFQLRFNTAGLTPGSTHAAVLRLSAPESNNKTLDVEVRMTVQPRVSSGFVYTVRQVLGGSANFSKPYQDDVPADTASATSCDAGFLETNGSLLVTCNDRVRRVDAATGRVRTVAGDGTRGDNAEGVPALQAKFNFTRGVVSTADGSIYVVDRFNNKVKRIRNGVVTTVVDNTFVVVPGTFPTRFSSPSRIFLDHDGRPMISASGGWVKLNANDAPLVALTPPQGPIVANAHRDNASGYLLVDSFNDRVWRHSGSVWRVFAGTGEPGYNGDGRPATETQLDGPLAAVPDAEGNVYILDRDNSRIRIVTSSGTVVTAALTGQAASTLPTSPIDLMVAPDGSLYLVTFNGVVKLERQRAPKPVAPAAGFVNAASNVAPLAPGSLFSLYGVNLAAAGETANYVPWPERLGGVAIRIGGRAARIYYTSGGQVNGQVPFEVPAGTATVEIDVNGTKSDPIQVQIVPAAPGIIAYGGNRAVAINPDGQLNGPDTPARAGQVIVIYFTGQGAVDQPVATGSVAPGDPLARPTAPYSATIGGETAHVDFLGLAPGYVGLGQANIVMPEGLPPGDHALVITIGDRQSEPVLVRIQ